MKLPFHKICINESDFSLIYTFFEMFSAIWCSDFSKILKKPNTNVRRQHCRIQICKRIEKCICIPAHMHTEPMRCSSVEYFALFPKRMICSSILLGLFLPPCVSRQRVAIHIHKSMVDRWTLRRFSIARFLLFFYSDIQ